MTTTAAEFLRAISDQPDDDFLRLTFTDFLEEQGDQGRADFIRVQLELDVLRQHQERFPNADGFRFRDPQSIAVDRLAAQLELHERALLGRHRDRWLPDFGFDRWWATVIESRARVVIYKDKKVNEAWGAVVFRRGLIEHVSLPLQGFMAHAAVLFAAAPITSVRLNDRRAFQADRSPHPERFWHWDRQRRGIPIAEDVRSALPFRLFDECFPNMRDGFFDSEDGANQALSDGCVRYGRKVSRLAT